MGVIAGLLSMFSWGMAIFLAAIASRKMGNVFTLFWMQLFGFVIALFFLLISFHSVPVGLVFKNVPILILVAVLQVIAYLAFYRGLEKAQVSLVSPIGAAWGFVTAVLGVVFLKENLNVAQVISLVLIICGIIILSVNIFDLVKFKKVNLLLGVKEGVIAMLGWGISLFLLVFATKDLGWFTPALVFRFFVLTILLAYIIYTGKLGSIKSKDFPLLLLILIGFFDIMGFFSYSLGVSGSQASVVAPIGSAFTLVTVILAKVFLKEKWDLTKIVGIFLIVSGLVLISV